MICCDNLDAVCFVGGLLMYAAEYLMRTDCRIVRIWAASACMKIAFGQHAGGVMPREHKLISMLCICQLARMPLQRMMQGPEQWSQSLYCIVQIIPNAW